MPASYADCQRPAGPSSCQTMPTSSATQAGFGDEHDGRSLETMRVEWPGAVHGPLDRPAVALEQRLCRRILGALPFPRVRRSC